MVREDKLRFVLKEQESESQCYNSSSAVHLSSPPLASISKPGGGSQCEHSSDVHSGQFHYLML